MEGREKNRGLKIPRKERGNERKRRKTKGKEKCKERERRGELPFISEGNGPCGKRKVAEK